jgi:hypothetical protein
MELNGLSGHCVMELNGRARPLNYGMAIELLSYQFIVPAIKLYNLMT